VYVSKRILRVVISKVFRGRCANVHVRGLQVLGGGSTLVVVQGIRVVWLTKVVQGENESERDHSDHSHTCASSYNLHQENFFTVQHISNAGYTYIYKNAYTYTYTCVCIHTHKQTPTHTHTNTRARTHTHTHTHSNCAPHTRARTHGDCSTRTRVHICTATWDRNDSPLLI